MQLHASLRGSRTHLLLLAAMLTVSFMQPSATPAETVMNIEIDYMVSAGHSHMPQPNEVAAVVQMFACHGITLNIVVDQAIPHIQVMQVDPSTCEFFNYTGQDSYGALRNAYFGHMGQLGWHYCIFGHQYANCDGTGSGSSGLSQGNGIYFTVTLGTFQDSTGTPFDRASTLAHEFGHNLGPGHGVYGPFPPNSPSIMSYFYQLAGVRTGMIASGMSTAETSLFKELDYSNGRICSLNESLLDERFGSGMVPVDWNCNGSIGGIASMSLDDDWSWCTSTDSSRHVLDDGNQWANLHDWSFVAVKDRPEPQTIRCISSEEMEQFRTAYPAARTQPPAVPEPCIDAKIVFLDMYGSATDGTCQSPLRSLGDAQAAATDGSHLFLLPGYYTRDVYPLVLSKPMTLFCEIGTATVNPAGP